MQGFEPYDKMAWPLYEVIAEYKLPAIFHSGHSGTRASAAAAAAACAAAADCGCRTASVRAKLSAEARVGFIQHLVRHLVHHRAAARLLLPCSMRRS